MQCAVQNAVRERKPERESRRICRQKRRRGREIEREKPNRMAQKRGRQRRAEKEMEVRGERGDREGGEKRAGEGVLPGVAVRGREPPPLHCLPASHGGSLPLPLHSLPRPENATNSKNVFLPKLHLQHAVQANPTKNTHHLPTTTMSQKCMHTQEINNECQANGVMPCQSCHMPHTTGLPVTLQRLFKVTPVSLASCPFLLSSLNAFSAFSLSDSPHTGCFSFLLLDGWTQISSFPEEEHSPNMAGNASSLLSRLL